MNALDCWADVYAEAVQLCDRIQRLPEACPCGDADAHLDRRCPCCARHETTGLRTGPTCQELIGTVQADAALFCADFRRLAATPGAPGSHERQEVRRGVWLTANELEGLLRALERVNDAVVGFRRNCTLTEMRRVKQHGLALRAHCDRLDQQLRGPGPRGTEEGAGVRRET